MVPSTHKVVFAILLATSSALALPKYPTKSWDTRSAEETSQPFENAPSVDAANQEWYQAYSSDASAQAVDSTTFDYKCFHGSQSELPTLAEWKDFDTLWDTNYPTLQWKQNWNIEEDGTQKNINAVIREKILLVAGEDKVDARLILAVIMQESSGSVNASCTGDEGVNCGLMQAPPGSKPFDSEDAANSIEQMIRDGVEGHCGSWPAGGPGLAWLLNSGASETSSWTGITIAGNPWQTLRAYNSGNVSDIDNLDDKGTWGTTSYVNDIANRLLGWDGWDIMTIGNEKGCANDYS